MIFAIADDNALLVFDDLVMTRGYCELIDVKNGEYDFFDAEGSPLKPEIFETKTPRKYFFGLISVTEKRRNFNLLPIKDSTTLLSSFDRISYLDKNSQFQTLEHVKNFLSA